MLSLFATILVVSVVLFIIISSKKEEDAETAGAKVYKVRGRYFFGLVLLLILALFVSLRNLPYDNFHKEADEIVTVVASQWIWKMGYGIYDGDLGAYTGGPLIDVEKNKTIDFQVTSMDITHNFAIYNSDGAIIRQVQAIPGYTNILQHTFTEEGKYVIECLEYCGTGHGVMVGFINVK